MVSDQIVGVCSLVYREHGSHLWQITCQVICQVRLTYPAQPSEEGSLQNKASTSKTHPCFNLCLWQISSISTYFVRPIVYPTRLKPNDMKQGEKSVLTVSVLDSYNGVGDWVQTSLQPQSSTFRGVYKVKGTRMGHDSLLKINYQVSHVLMCFLPENDRMHRTF